LANLAVLSAQLLLIYAMNILEELQWRGLLADCTDTAELTKRVSPPLTSCTVDSTTRQPACGNLVPLLAAPVPNLVIIPSRWRVGRPIHRRPERQTQERQLLTRNSRANIAQVKDSFASCWILKRPTIRKLVATPVDVSGQLP